MSSNFKKVIWMLLCILDIPGSLCLRNVYVIVPEAAERGTKVRLQCIYELENEVLYTVKWYRGDREFCRYEPRAEPALKVFRIPGIEVERNETNEKQLTMIPMTRVAAGRYTCEVSADEPSFQTALVTSHMYVVDLPEDPEMIGIKQSYRPGMTLKAECFSRNSMPAANLSFFINSKRASSQHVWHRVDMSASSRLMTAYIAIQFVVQKHHFVDERLKVRCTAIIYSIYVKSLEKSAIEVLIPTTTTSEPELRQARKHSLLRPPKKPSLLQALMKVKEATTGSEKTSAEKSRPETQGDVNPTVTSFAAARIVPLATILLPTVLI